jgi:hypothetical protein
MEASNLPFNPTIPQPGFQDSSGIGLAGLDLASPFAGVLQTLPPPARQYIAALKNHIATLEAKLSDATAELDILKKAVAQKPTW